MALSSKMLSALADAIEEHAKGEFGREDGEETVDYLRRVMPAITGDINAKARLTPFEVGLYDLRKNALAAIYKDMGHSKEEAKSFVKLEKYEMVSRLTRLHKTNKAETEEAVLKRIYSSSKTIDQYQLKGAPFPAEAKRILKSHLQKDIFSGDEPTIVGSQFIPTNAVITDGHRYVVTMSRAIDKGENLGNDYRVSSITALQNIHLVIDPQAGLVEYRGIASQAKNALSAFTNIFRENKHFCEYQSIEFTEQDANDLKEELDAALSKVKWVDPEGQSSGIGSHTPEVHEAFRDKNGKRDMSNAAGYKDFVKTLSDDAYQSAWHLAFKRGREEVSIHINMASGTVRFPEGEVTDNDIRYVTKALAKVRKKRIFSPENEAG